MKLFETEIDNSPEAVARTVLIIRVFAATAAAAAYVGATYVGVKVLTQPKPLTDATQN